MDAAAGRASELYDAYTSAAARLADDEQFVSARERWASFVTASHGDVFADVDDDNPRRAAFRDALYYDFVVERAIDSVEGSLGVELENRAPNANTDALDVPVRTLHERVLAEAAIRFYAGAPIRTPDGDAVGVFCLFDDEPRSFPERDRTLLSLLADEVMAGLETRRRLREATEDDDE